jgi:hypothetical protein
MINFMKNLWITFSKLSVLLGFLRFYRSFRLWHNIDTSKPYGAGKENSMSGMKRLLETQSMVLESIAKATGMPFIGKPKFTEDEMEMGRYDHARSDEVDSTEDEQW